MLSSSSPSPFLGLLVLLHSAFLNPSLATHNDRFSQTYPSSLVFQSETTPSGSFFSTLAESERISSSNPPNHIFSQPSRSKLVPVVLGVMSKCPDAQICEDVFDKVLAEVSDKVDVLVAYMGDIDPSARYGVRCRHGDPECRANAQQLCYRNRFPKLHDWWGFIQCQNYAGLSRIGEEMLARSCAKVAQHDWDKDVKECVDGPQGQHLLVSSAKLVKHLLIEKSCSIFINHQLVCIHDGTWKDCQSGHEVGDFVKYIKHQYELINPPTKE